MGLGLRGLQLEMERTNEILRVRRREEEGEEKRRDKERRLGPERYPY